MNIPEKAQKSLDKVLEMYKSGEFPKAVAKTLIDGSGKPSSDWSFTNQMIMLAHGTTDARGYNQWKKAGRQVQKGSKAFYIFGPNLVEKETDELDENGDPKTETILTGFHTIPVFAKEDTEGDSLEYEPEERPELESVAEALGYEVEYSPSDGTAYGSIELDNNRINLNSEANSTFFHELAHGVDDFLSEDGLEVGQNAEQEIVAESVAASLCELYGFEGEIEHTSKYLERYSEEGEDAYDAIRKHLSRIEKVLGKIMELAKATKEKEREVVAV